jgi:hypothetical protein
MTPREKINLQFRAAKKWVMTGFGIFFFGIISLILFQSFGPKNNPLTGIVIVAAIGGWVLAAIGFLKFHLSVKCPICRGKLWFLQMSSNRNFWQLDFPGEYKYCVYCGSDFDGTKSAV